MDDRARLYRLVQLVKTLDEDHHGDDDCGGDGGVEISNSTGRTPTRRQLDFSGGSSWSQPRHGRAGMGVRLCDNHTDRISQVIGRPTNRSSQTRETARPLSNHKPSLKCTGATRHGGSRLTNQNVDFWNEDTPVRAGTMTRQRGRGDHGTPVRRPLSTLVSESPGYNYGLPLSSPVTHRK